MSSASSILLTSYENNNEDASGGKKRTSAIPVDIKTGSKCDGAVSKVPRKCCGGIHLNNLWSFWYGILGTGLQAYTAVKCLKRILGYSFLTWPDNLPIPYLELNTSLGLTGAAVLLLPLFMASAIFKIGNLANDGVKLGRQMNVCSKEMPHIIHDASAMGSCGLWKHGGPTAPFVHLVIAFCLLLPKLLMEARLIEGGFLPQESIWRTDLDFMVVHRDRLVVLSFMTTSSNATANSVAAHQQFPSALPLKTVADVTSNSSEAVDAAVLPFSGNHVTHTVLKTLKEIIGHDDPYSHQHLYSDTTTPDTIWGSTVSVEYLNLALALLVYSVRYPSLFWATNKCMGILFSFQLLLNGLHTLLAYAGMSILYKVQIVGVEKVLPLLKHPRGVGAGILMTAEGTAPFLLNSQVTLAFYLLSALLVLSSSLVLYLYGHTRLNAFLERERGRKVITLKEGSGSRWSYFTHCAALSVLVAAGVSNAPLLHDYTVVYKGSLDDMILACIIGGILHLFFWVVIWLFLTIKQNWMFKLQATASKTTLRHARSTEVDYKSQRCSEPGVQQPLLIVGNGRTYSISDTSSKKVIMGVVQESSMAIRRKCENGYVTPEEVGEEQIYWLRPALITPQSSPEGSKQFCCFNKKPKHKVTFNESSSTSVNRGKSNGCRGGRKPGNDEDDGDYATLRELPLLPSSTATDIANDMSSEEGKLLARVHDQHVTYASNVQDLVPPALSCENPNLLLTPEPLFHQNETDSSNQKPPTVITVHNQPQQNPLTTTPRCLRRADSGVPPDALTPRSDSLSTESSTSPPEQHPGSNHSESSSGVHSNDSSSEHHQSSMTGIIVQQARRTASVIDLMQQHQPPGEEEMIIKQWRSCSLQRNATPPTNGSNHVNKTISSGGVPHIADILDQSNHSIPAVILENPSESTVVIRRKATKPKMNDTGSSAPPMNEEPFGRATNMRMTSFMETSDLKNIKASSATLPHYLTQPAPVPLTTYPHCSTMPLPQHVSNNVAANLDGGNSCNIYPRQHSTIPTHHNGVKLFNSTQNHFAPSYHYVKKLHSDIPVKSHESIYTGINRLSGENYHYKT